MFLYKYNINIQQLFTFFFRYQIPEDWPYKEARQLFKEPLVCSGDNEVEIKWTAPNEEVMIIEIFSVHASVMCCNVLLCIYLCVKVDIFHIRINLLDVNCQFHFAGVDYFLGKRKRIQQ